MFRGVEDSSVERSAPCLDVTRHRLLHQNHLGKMLLVKLVSERVGWPTHHHKSFKCHPNKKKKAASAGSKSNSKVQPLASCVCASSQVLAVRIGVLGMCDAWCVAALTVENKCIHHSTSEAQMIEKRVCTCLRPNSCFSVPTLVFAR